MWINMWARRLPIQTVLSMTLLQSHRINSSVFKSEFLYTRCRQKTAIFLCIHSLHRRSPCDHSCLFYTPKICLAATPQLLFMLTGLGVPPPLPEMMVPVNEHWSSWDGKATLWQFLCIDYQSSRDNEPLFCTFGFCYVQVREYYIIWNKCFMFTKGH